MNRQEKGTDTTHTEGLPGFCGLPPQIERHFQAGIDPKRASLIRVISQTWANGTQIHYCFWDSNVHGSTDVWDGSDQDKNVVRQAWKTWKDLGIGLEFIEVDDPNDAEVRIGFQQNDGSWSYMGSDVLNRPQDQRTMNFGWPLHTDRYGMTTALHEIGHTLGFPHEQQNPKAGIVWNEDNVYRKFRGKPNEWEDPEIYHNILRKIAPTSVEGSIWDPTSIMHYSFDASLIDAPKPYSEEGIPVNYDLSQEDIKRVRRFYPPLVDELPELVLFQSFHAKLQPGDQLDFVVRPDRTRKYRIQTLGKIDSLLTLFEKRTDGAVSYLAADDDGGLDTNASIEYKLFKGREYIVRLRFYYAMESGNAVLVLL